MLILEDLPEEMKSVLRRLMKVEGILSSSKATYQIEILTKLLVSGRVDLRKLIHEFSEGGLVMKTVNILEFKGLVRREGSYLVITDYGVKFVRKLIHILS